MFTPSTRILLSLLAISYTTAASPLSPRQDSEVAWSFSVYQSLSRCTGATDTYNGTASQGCTKGIRNGSFGSYIRGNISSGCSVYLYRDDGCSLERIIDVLSSDIETDCSQAVIEHANVPSFDVVCE
ncbi:hypothetical protein G6011_08156 [Alternaria panax]|uniref:Uncharacterized protein n=1 Tax=Alternaria panax TaxID=48097 RepID=A0AAD4FJF8_9PLEO|nr:hypothetical protein G6011_08156 [Alternaria panax]